MYIIKGIVPLLDKMKQLLFISCHSGLQPYYKWNKHMSTTQKTENCMALFGVVGYDLL